MTIKPRRSPSGAEREGVAVACLAVALACSGCLDRSTSPYEVASPPVRTAELALIEISLMDVQTRILPVAIDPSLAGELDGGIEALSARIRGRDAAGAAYELSRLERTLPLDLQDPDLEAIRLVLRQARAYVNRAE